MNKCFFRVLPTYLVFIFSLSGWVTSVFLYNEIRQHQHFVQEGKLTNPFNILKLSLTDLSSESEIYRKNLDQRLFSLYLWSRHSQ